VLASLLTVVAWGADVLRVEVFVERSVIWGEGTRKLSKTLRIRHVQLGARCVFASMSTTCDSRCWWSMADVPCCYLV
jgi:hypothetical protein